MKNIAVLTSGGDCQGMNTCLNIIVKMAELYKGLDVFGVRLGFKGLIEDEIYPLKYNNVANIASVGGTYLKSARCKEFMSIEGRKKAVANLKKHKIDALIVIGGDGSFNGVAELNKLGVKTIAIPGTIDNDLFYTDYCLGFHTAVGVAANAIESIQQTMSSLERCSIIEVMGRYCGSIALFSAAATACEVLAVPEHAISEAEVIAKVKYSLAKGVKAPTIIISEHQFDIKQLAKNIEKATGIETRANILGHIQRGGSPVVRDRMLAMQFSVRAIDLLIEGKFNRAVGIKSGIIIDVSMEDAIKAKSNFNEEIYKIFTSLNK